MQTLIVLYRHRLLYNANNKTNEKGKLHTHDTQDTFLTLKPSTMLLKNGSLLKMYFRK
jgi:hypothetical protein